MQENPLREQVTNDFIFLKETASIAQGAYINEFLDFSDAKEVLLLVSYNGAFTYSTPHYFPVISGNNSLMRSYHYVNTASYGAIQAQIASNVITIANQINEAIIVRIYKRK